MSKRAEITQANAQLPESIISYAKEHTVMAGLVYREGVKFGYEQAEKDLALTWEDIAFICQTCTEVINSLPDKPCAYTPGFKDLYGEVLNRFNEQKKK